MQQSFGLTCATAGGLRANTASAFHRRKMKIIVMVVVFLLLLTTVAAAQEQLTSKSSANASVLEAKVRKVWEDFKNKNKQSLVVALDDNFRMIEEGTSGFGDKKAAPRWSFMRRTTKANTKARRRRRTASSAKFGLARAVTTTGRRFTCRKPTFRKQRPSD